MPVDYEVNRASSRHAPVDGKKHAVPVDEEKGTVCPSMRRTKNLHDPSENANVVVPRCENTPVDEDIRTARPSTGGSKRR